MPGFEWTSEDAAPGDEILSVSSIEHPLPPIISPEKDQNLEKLKDFLFRKMFSRSVVSATVCKAYGLDIAYDTVLQLVKDAIVDNSGEVGTLIDVWSESSWEYAKTHDKRLMYWQEAQ